MPFELNSPPINGLIPMRMLTDVAVTRRLLGHSCARLTLDTDEMLLEPAGNCPLGQKGAAMLNADVTLRWHDRDGSQDVVCFRGYVSGVRAERREMRSYLVIDCVSYSQRTDLVPHHRVWQACTLLDVCTHIAGQEPLIHIAPEAAGVLGGIDIPLSVQYHETDYAYLRRMLHAWGIPLTQDEPNCKVVIGAPSLSGSGDFPALSERWSRTALEAEVVALDGKAHAPGSGPPGVARGQSHQFDADLQHGADQFYYPRLDDAHQKAYAQMADRIYTSGFESGVVLFHALWRGGVFDYPPGSTAPLAGQTWIVREVRITGDAQQDTASQEFVLCDQLSPFLPDRLRTNWPSHTLWAHVTKNNAEDPQQIGRVQVEFDWAPLDPTGSARCWLPVMTPYSGLKGKGSTSGFLSLPEVGERVLVQFLDHWDSNAVVIGSVREYSIQEFPYLPHETRRWQTPSGNQITLTTKGEGATDIVQIKCRDKLIFRGKITPGKETVVMDFLDGGDDRIHFERSGAKTRLDIFCTGEIYMHADDKLLLEGGSVQIKSTAGTVNIDGELVNLNCGPWSLDPLKLEFDPKVAPAPPPPIVPPAPPTYALSFAGAGAGGEAESNEPPIREEKPAPPGSAKLFYWPPKFPYLPIGGGSVGHLAMELAQIDPVTGQPVYVSWWPGGFGLASPSTAHTFKQDLEAEGNRPPQVKELSGLDEEAMQRAWEQRQSHSAWNPADWYTLEGSNCADAVAETLQAGGQKGVPPPMPIWGPLGAPIGDARWPGLVFNALPGEAHTVPDLAGSAPPVTDLPAHPSPVPAPTPDTESQ